MEIGPPLKVIPRSILGKKWILRIFYLRLKNTVKIQKITILLNRGPKYGKVFPVTCCDPLLRFYRDLVQLSTNLKIPQQVSFSKAIKSSEKHSSLVSSAQQQSEALKNTLKPSRAFRNAQQVSPILRISQKQF